MTRSFRGALCAFVLAVTGVVAASPAAGAATFGTPTAYPLDGAAADRIVVTGDLDRDGRPDLVVAQRGAAGLTVLTNAGDGTFTPVSVPVSAPAQDVAIADVDRDGYGDVVVAGSASLEIYRGGTAMTTPSVTPAPAGITAIAVGDVDRDGLPDVVATSPTPNVLLFRGSGDLSMLDPQSAAPSGLPGGATALELADLDRDGNLDAAIGSDSGPATMLGDGSGGFAAPAAVGSGSDASALVVADLDRDGISDLLTGAATSGAVSVGRGAGDGTFTPLPSPATPAGTGRIAVGDLDRDGIGDLVATSASGVVALAGESGGVFGAADEISPSGSIGDLALADFDGDGRLDVATADRDSAVLDIRLNTTPFRAPNFLGSPAPAPATDGGPASVTVGDLDRDGIPDLAVIEQTASSVGIFLGNGDGTYAARTDYRTGALNSPVDCAIADLNRDGVPDLLIANYGGNTVGVLLGNGDGSFQPAATYDTGSFTSPNGIVVADFNRDGRPDAATANEFMQNVSVLLGNGNGTLQTAVAYDAEGQLAGLTAGDFNRDGKADLVTVGRTGDRVSVLLGNGDGTFAPADSTSRLPLAGGAFATESADLDGDGNLDVVVASYFSGVVSVLRGRGDGTFEGRVESVVPGRPRALAIGDLDDDGVLDVAAADGEGSTVSLLYGNGDGTLADPRSQAVAATPYGVAIADLDRDGMSDLVASGYTVQELTVLRAVTDTTAPDTSDDVTSGWSRFRVPVTLNAVDSGGSGVAATYYEIGPAPATPTTASSVYDRFSPPLLADGEKVSYFSVDGAGNAGGVRTSAAARVDTTKPTTTDDVPVGWQRSPVTVTLTATDGSGSGVAATYYTTGAAPTAPTTSSTRYDPDARPALNDGEKIRYFSVDAVGNRGAVTTSAAAQVDGTAPDPPALASGPPASSDQTSATVEFGGETTATFTCSVDGGPAAACTSPLALNDLAVGDHVVTVTQVDLAGNVGDPLTVRFTVTGPAAGRDDGDDTPGGGGETPGPGGDLPHGGGDTPGPDADLPPGGGGGGGGGGVTPPGGATTPPPASSEATSVLPRVGGRPGVRADVVFTGVTAVSCSPNAGTIVACELEARSVRAIHTADGRDLRVGTVLAVGSARPSAAGLVTKRLKLTRAGLAALVNHPLGRAARLVLRARTPSGGVVVSETTIRLRFLAGQSLTIRWPGRSSELPEHVRDALERLVRAVSPVTSVKCIADTDAGVSAAADLALTRLQAKRACDFLGAHGLKGKRTSVGRGHAHPRASSRTGAGRALNRRLTLLIMP